VSAVDLERPGTGPPGDVGAEALELMCRLFPLNRSLTGAGVQVSFDVLACPTSGTCATPTSPAPRTKHALKAMADALREEVNQHGVRDVSDFAAGPPRRYKPRSTPSRGSGSREDASLTCAKTILPSD
jgi:hypothetical protein